MSVQEAIRQYNIINSKNRKRKNDIITGGRVTIDGNDLWDWPDGHFCPRCGDAYQGLHLFCGSPSVDEVLKCRFV